MMISTTYKMYGGLLSVSGTYLKTDLK